HEVAREEQQGSTGVDITIDDIPIVLFEEEINRSRACPSILMGAKTCQCLDVICRNTPFLIELLRQTGNQFFQIPAYLSWQSMDIEVQTPLLRVLIPVVTVMKNRTFQWQKVEKDAGII